MGSGDARRQTAEALRKRRQERLQADMRKWQNIKL
jgi:hypothetical protein